VPWDGRLWAIDTDDGRTIWSTYISDYTGVPDDLSRTSRAYWRRELFLGTNAPTVPQSGAVHGAYLVCLNARTGRQR
jgi:outer membrane protein assembly factor BamB